ncbi:hypothetical protein CAPTEDRAFT_205644 [Capitella teleta]|uniref:Uncharacterized protein n=1 Tax=Capitella teleta TaxID=283909 RepID=R7UTL6_CAPTE|nr:hypothetical protein CAPTEDRAFT_205644 [Capitella teleta]|eukprot:ELU09859.1 hypothetical protein CAPTEDRAFT_205644 [Capitella teleta]
MGSDPPMIILNNVLAYAAYGVATSTSDHTKEACVDFFSSEEIIDARDLLWGKCENGILPKMIKRQNTTTKKGLLLTTSDIIEAIQKLGDSGSMPIFAVEFSSLGRLPLAKPKHWGLTDQMRDLESRLDNARVYGKSGMDESQPLVGRPHGGCAVIVRKDLKCSVEPVTTMNKRLFSCLIRLPDLSSVSLIDHFAVDEVLFEKVLEYYCLHRGDNLSDHSPLFLVLQLDSAADCVPPSSASTGSSRVSWSKASEEDIADYKHVLSYLLEQVIPPSLRGCIDSGFSCDSENHRGLIEHYFETIPSACLAAAEVCIPKQGGRKRVAGVGVACVTVITLSTLGV